MQQMNESKKNNDGYAVCVSVCKQIFEGVQWRCANQMTSSISARSRGARWLHAVMAHHASLRPARRARQRRQRHAAVGAVGHETIAIAVGDRRWLRLRWLPQPLLLLFRF